METWTIGKSFGEKSLAIYRLLSFYGDRNYPFVIWKQGASIPLKGFLFCRFLFILLPETQCQLIFACF